MEKKTRICLWAGVGGCSCQQAKKDAACVFWGKSGDRQNLRELPLTPLFSALASICPSTTADAKEVQGTGSILKLRWEGALKIALNVRERRAGRAAVLGEDPPVLTPRALSVAHGACEVIGM